MLDGSCSQWWSLQEFYLDTRLLQNRTVEIVYFTAKNEMHAIWRPFKNLYKMHTTQKCLCINFKRLCTIINLSIDFILNIWRVHVCVYVYVYICINLYMCVYTHKFTHTSIFFFLLGKAMNLHCFFVLAAQLLFKVTRELTWIQDYIWWYQFE